MSGKPVTHVLSHVGYQCLMIMEPKLVLVIKNSMGMVSSILLNLAKLTPIIHSPSYSFVPQPGQKASSGSNRWPHLGQV
jgi:hypothetical protein